MFGKIISLWDIIYLVHITTWKKFCQGFEQEGKRNIDRKIVKSLSSFPWCPHIEHLNVYRLSGFISWESGECNPHTISYTFNKSWLLLVKSRHRIQSLKELIFKAMSLYPLRDLIKCFHTIKSHISKHQLKHQIVHFYCISTRNRMYISKKKFKKNTLQIWCWRDYANTSLSLPDRTRSLMKPMAWCSCYSPRLSCT